MLFDSVIPILCCGYFIRRVDHQVVFDDFLILGVALIMILVVVLTVRDNRIKYLKTGKIIEFTSGVVNLLIIILLFAAFYILNLRDTSPSKMYCDAVSQKSENISIDFREDNTYKLIRRDLGMDIYRGAYTMKDSIITLEKSEVADIIVSNRLSIKHDIKFHGRQNGGGLDTIKRTLIYQTDVAGNTIYNSISFIVREH